MARRLAALLAALTLCVGNLAVCAGWQATPEARMACCKNGANCPMHDAESDGHSSKNSVSQAQADSCCATSAQRRESSAASTFASSGVIALMPATVFPVPTIVRAAQDWRVLAPLPVSSVPKHLLLSVLLV